MSDPIDMLGQRQYREATERDLKATEDDTLVELVLTYGPNFRLRDGSSIMDEIRTRLLERRELAASLMRQLRWHRERAMKPPVLEILESVLPNPDDEAVDMMQAVTRARAEEARDE